MPPCSILRFHGIQPALPGCNYACAWAFPKALTCAQGHQSMALLCSHVQGHRTIHAAPI